MNVRGLVLMGFSGLCLSAAVMTHKVQEQRMRSHGLVSAVSSGERSCMRGGFDTSGGRVGCFQPVSAAIGLFGGKNYRGGSAMARR